MIVPPSDLSALARWGALDLVVHAAPPDYCRLRLPPGARRPLHRALLLVPLALAAVLLAAVAISDRREAIPTAAIAAPQ